MDLSTMAAETSSHDFYFFIYLFIFIFSFLCGCVNCHLKRSNQAYCETSTSEALQKTPELRKHHVASRSKTVFLQYLESPISGEKDGYVSSGSISLCFPDPIFTTARIYMQ